MALTGGDGGLQGFIAQTRLGQMASLELLRETRLVIDGLHYLARCASLTQGQEPLLPGSGGQPVLLYQLVLEEIAALKKAGIKPVFVLPGLNPNTQAEASKQRWMREEFAAAQRNQAWAVYNGENVQDVAKFWSYSTPFLMPDLLRGLVRLLKRNDVELIQAPFSARAQIAYLLQHPKRYAHATWGRADQLLYQGIGQVITHVDLVNKTFTFVRKGDLLRATQLSEDQLVDVCILSGSDASDLHPATNELALYSFLDARLAVSQYRSGFTALVAQKPNMPPTRPALVDNFCRTKTAFRFHLVLSNEGLVKPLPIALQECQAQPDAESLPHAPISLADVPSDLDQIFHRRLPDEIFLYLSKTLAGTPPVVVQYFVSGTIVEERPLCNGETAQYRNFVESVIQGIRSISLGFLASAMHSSWHERPVKVVFWYDPENERPLPRAGPNDPKLKRALTWQMNSRTIEDELRIQNSSTIDIALCLNVTSNQKSAAKTILTTSQAHLDKRDEIRATVICRLLETRGLFTDSHTHTPFASALHEGLKGTRLNDRLQEPLYLGLELIRYGVLSGDRYSVAYGGGPTTGSPETDRHCLLVMRVLSLIPATLKQGRSYDGPLSKELLAFNSMATILTKSLRGLVEAITLHFLLVGPVKKRSRDDFVDLAQALPFREVNSTIVGVLGKAYFDACDELRRNRDDDLTVEEREAPTTAEEKSQLWEYFETPFGALTHPKVDLEKGFRLWDAMVVAVRRLFQMGGTTMETDEAFRDADGWLKVYR